MSVSDPFATRLNTDLHETSIAALAFHIWESLISLDLEVEHIWNLNKPRTRWIRAVFFFMRYFTLSAQICNRILAERVLQRQYMSYVALRTWYICQVVVAQLSMTAVETVMLARVYALYHNNRWVGIVLLSVLVVECLVVAAGIAITLPHIDFTPESVVTSVPHSFAYLGISAFTTQVIILVLTTVRYFRGHWAGTSLGKLLIRDGSIAFIMFFCNLSLTSNKYCTS
ncbi:hypothetical protein C8J57DRAFT_586830 [Mycena rebaudengoi]|nr:hypothetical protein C8J57DRAFT_586830 [Mycena rebaudengoi]